MKETPNFRVASEQIPWPEGISGGVLQRLLEQNQNKGDLKRVVADYLFDEAACLFLDEETEELLPQFKGNPIVEGYSIFAAELRDALEDYDYYIVQGHEKDFEKEWHKAVEEDDALKDRFDQWGNYIFDFWDRSDADLFIGDSSYLFEEKAGYLADIYLALEEDIRGFVLADVFVDKNPFSPGTPKFKAEEIGRTKAAQRYKELYNLLVEKGATWR